MKNDPSVHDFYWWITCILMCNQLLLTHSISQELYKALKCYIEKDEYFIIIFHLKDCLHLFLIHPTTRRKRLTVTMEMIIMFII